MFVPVVWFPLTVTVPPYVAAAGGVKPTVTSCVAPATIVPLHAPLNPAG